jgi:hypothetical protein
MYKNDNNSHILISVYNQLLCLQALSIPLTRDTQQDAENRAFYSVTSYGILTMEIHKNNGISSVAISVAVVPLSVLST